MTGLWKLKHSTSTKNTEVDTTWEQVFSHYILISTKYAITKHFRLSALELMQKRKQKKTAINRCGVSQVFSGAA